MQERRTMREAGKRASLASLIISSPNRLSPRDLKVLCLSVHHGGSRLDLRRAQAALYKTPINDDSTVLLSKQMIDRILVMKYRAQRHGTQYRISNNQSVEPFPVITTKQEDTTSL